MAGRGIFRAHLPNGLHRATRAGGSGWGCSTSGMSVSLIGCAQTSPSQLPAQQKPARAMHDSGCEVRGHGRWLKTAGFADTRGIAAGPLLGMRVEEGKSSLAGRCERRPMHAEWEDPGTLTLTLDILKTRLYSYPKDIRDWI